MRNIIFIFVSQVYKNKRKTVKSRLKLSVFRKKKDKKRVLYVNDKNPTSTKCRIAIPGLRYSRLFVLDPLFLLALVIRYRDPGQKTHNHCTSECSPVVIISGRWRLAINFIWLYRRNEPTCSYGC